MNKFDCDKCGLCCQNLKKSNVYDFLDRGNGTCRYYIEETRLCSIYERRPLLCNIDAYYDKFLSHSISREEFHKLNFSVCQKLKKERH